jgi:hypothetical protein
MKATKQSSSRSVVGLIVMAVVGFSLVRVSGQVSTNTGPLKAPFSAFSNQPVRPGATKVLAETGPNHRIWKNPAPAPSAAPANAPAVKGRSGAAHVPKRPQQEHGVVEIATGMNYWDGQKWAPSNPVFEVSPDGTAFIANQVQHKVRLAGNLNSVGAINLMTPDGVLLQSTPVAIALYDAASGRSGIIAAITNCTGILAADGKQVVWENAFDSICADVVVSLDRGSFEQDVVITGRLDPADYGFPTNTTRIQVITEFYGAPTPDEVTHPIYVEQNAAVRQRLTDPDVMDNLISWGEFGLATGQAFLAGTVRENGSAVAVAKQFRQIGGRTFLIESAVYGPLAKSLSSLPDCRPTSASLGLRKDVWRLALANPTIPEANQLQSGGAVKLASAAVKRSPGVTIDYIGTLGGTISTNIVFRGDTTYFVSGAVYCNGSVTIEGGAVFKYPKTTAFLQINSTLTCATSAYRPAIFTAGDDESIGDSVQGIWTSWTGTVDTNTCYANPALLVNYVSAQLSNLRFSYCKDSIKLYVPTGNTPSVTDCQLVSCIKGIHIAGFGSGSGSGGTGALIANNTLFGWVASPVTTDYVTGMSGTFTECTFDNCQNLMTCTGQGGGNWYFYNSVLSHVTNLLSGAGAAVSGAYNGIYKSPTLGSSPIQENPNQPSAFAPSFDGLGGIYDANGQGRYYLRNGSPFVNTGSSSYVSSSLAADLAQRTVFCPADPLRADFVLNTTLGQKQIRDTDTPDLGYHYPAVDFIINGVTVNNCTLNIDQGTVLAYMGDYYNSFNYWGIRVNTGGRLVVNGTPTNRVIFARLEAVQENPYYDFRPAGPTITFEGMHFPVNYSAIAASPMPEAKIRYADFPTISTPTDNWGFYGYWPGSIAPMDTWPTDPYYPAFYADYWYEDVSNLELTGCLFQGGFIHYISGGWQPRTVSIRNNIFERCDVYVYDWGEGSVAETLVTANNLFYGNAIGLAPVINANWTFTDNLFDKVQWVSNQVSHILLNGPVSVNKNNGYVLMAGNHLSPSTDQTATDKDMNSFAYITGPLGRFYVPTTSILLGAGSQLAKNSALFHFTMLANNAKEANNQVGIGPHYLALVSGYPADSNTDGIPDFIADANGDGTEGTDEVPWSTSNPGVLKIVSPLNGSQVSGTIQLRCNPGASAQIVESVSLFVDGVNQGTVVRNPAKATASMELDTRYLSNASHSLVAVSSTPQADGSRLVCSSASISVTVANTTHFENLQQQAGLGLTLQFATTPSEPNYTLWFYGSDYAKSYNPTYRNFATGVNSTGLYDYSCDITAAGYQTGDVDPTLHVFVSNSSSDASQAFELPGIRQGKFPGTGKWVITYDSLCIDQRFYKNNPILDPVDTRNGGTPLWIHGEYIGRWWSIGNAAGGTLCIQDSQNASTPQNPQTYPVRYLPSQRANDLGQLKKFLQDDSAANFFGASHGTPNSFMDLSPDDLRGLHLARYRFVFLDGCWTDSWSLMLPFGAAPFELVRGISQPSQLLTINDYRNYALNKAKLRPGAFLGWKCEVPLAYSLNPPVNGSSWKHLTSKANWHITLLDSWTLNNRTIKQAIDDAALVASLTFEPNEAAWTTWVVSAEDSSGNPTAQARFDPGLYVGTWGKMLQIYGCSELKYQDFNQSTQWP